MSAKLNKFGFLLVLIAAFLSENAAAASFDNKSIKGSYAASIEGVYTFIDRATHFSFYFAEIPARIKAITESPSEM